MDLATAIPTTEKTATKRQPKNRANTDQVEFVKATFNLPQHELDVIRDIACAKGVPVTSVFRQLLLDVRDIRALLDETDGRLFVIDGDERVQLIVPSLTQ